MTAIEEAEQGSAQPSLLELITQFGAL
jgi:hypothetical protein